MLVALTRAKKVEISDELLENLNKTTDGLQLKDAFRCGIFIINPKNENERPISDLIIFNKTFDATSECRDGEPQVEKYNDFCSSIWNKGIKKRGTVKLASPSLDKARAEEGHKIGDDICGLLKKKIKAPFVGRKSRKFPNGLKFGMFSNSCGNPLWTFAGVKHLETVCCWRGKLADCP